jgi:glycosyltransferase involved in cell wall biosynthesis
VPAAAGADVLFLPMVDWHTRIQRPQHLAHALAARGRRVFYLNPNLGREFPYPVCIGDRLAVCRIADRIWELHTGLPREPVFHHRLLTHRESRYVASSIAGVLKGFDCRRLLIVCQFPLWTETAQLLRRQFPSVFVYDCHDLLSGFARISPEILDAERRLFDQADFSVFTARTLIEQLRDRHPSLSETSVVIRNGVDVRHFQPVAGGRSRVVGYAGSLDDWFDVECVRQSALDHPSVQFVFLGRIESGKVRRLEPLANVRFYGEVPYQQLPAYMAEFDAALIPFLITPLTMATNPIKLYEYFACGLPVVSTPLPEVERFGQLVYIARTAKDFSAQVGRALAERDADLRQARRDVASRESWQARADQLLDAVETFSRRK